MLCRIIGKGTLAKVIFRHHVVLGMVLDHTIRRGRVVPGAWAPKMTIPHGAEEGAMAPKATHTYIYLYIYASPSLATPQHDDVCDSLLVPFYSFSILPATQRLSELAMKRPRDVAIEQIYVSIYIYICISHQPSGRPSGLEVVTG